MKTIGQRLLTTLAIAAALLAFSPGVVSAATINWTFSEIVNIGGAQSETGTGFLVPAGDLAFAENSGGGALTHDSIDFAAGSFSLGGEASPFHASAPLTGTATFGTNGNSGPPVVVTIGSGAGELGGVDLTPGQDYRLQLIIMDGRGNQAGRSIEIDGFATDHALGVSGQTWGNALLATGIFTADGPTQSYESRLTGRPDTQINAVSLHAIPEPASLALLALSGLVLVRRRRSA